VRKFYQHFHKVWPYWFFFCDLGTETLTMMTLCLMPNLASFKRLGEPLAKVEYDPADLLPLISRDLGPLNRMMERARLSELAIYERTRHVFIPTGFQQGADVAFQLVFIRQVHGAMGRRVVRSDSPPFDIDTFEAIIPLERAIKQLVPDDEPPDLGDQTAGVSNDWNQSRPDPSEVDLGDGRILVPCFD
jgi:hypothetical protein